MKGILLAGGTGSRLYPSTKVTNKHLLNVYNKPMIEYPLHTLKQLGVDEVIVIVGKEHCGSVISYLNDKEEFDFTYKIQNKADGIAGAINLCKNIIKDESFYVILGDNIYQNLSLPEEKKACHIVVKPTQTPERFGILTLNGESMSIEEKPKHPISDLAVTGLYLFDHTAFDKLESMTKSDRGEYEVTQLIEQYMNEGRVSYSIHEGFWSDAGTEESLLYCANFLSEDDNED
jgi:glucose-1-phosphate thymidylyltransferase